MARHNGRTSIVVTGWLVAFLVVAATATATAQQSTLRPPERSVIRSRSGGGGGGGGGGGSGGGSGTGSTRTAPAVPTTRLPVSRVAPPRSSASTAARVLQGPANQAPANQAPANVGPANQAPANAAPSPRRGVVLPEAPPEEIFPSGQEAVEYAGPPVPPGYVVEMDGPSLPGAESYEEYVEGEPYDQGYHASDSWFGGHPGRGHGYGHGHGPGGTCPTCGGMGCPGCWFGGYGLLNGLRLRGEFLRWQSSGMHVPALVTTSNTAAPTPPVTQAGVLGAPNTQILFGNGEILDNAVSGGRFYAGLPLDYDQRLVLEGEYFSLEEAADSFFQSSGGTPILARPFFNLLTSPNNIPAESSELVAYPGVVRGAVGVDASSTFQGAAARLRYLLCCSEGCVPSLSWRNPQVMGGYRMELTGGYRYLKLHDQLRITENLTSTSPAGTFNMFDDFQTDNQFHGVELGMLLQTRRGRWTMDWVSRIGIGSTSGTSLIAGQTSINGAPSVNGALLAQSSNIGTFDTSDFAMTPELGLMLGFDLTPRFRLIAGYSMIYWSRVLRAGDQIDREINPNLIPPPISPLVGPLRPEQNFVWSDYWAQGLSVGLEGHW